MNDIFTEVFGTPDTSKQTPIEIALGVDAQGMTTAKKLYKFLELEPAHYARWCEKNILQNRFAERDVDFWAFTTNGEWGGQASTDFKLTASFAKKLSMVSKSPKGEAARNYFVGMENGTKKLVRKELPPEQIPIGEIASYIKAMDRVFVRQQLAPYKIAEAFVMLSKQFGIHPPEGCVKNSRV